MCLMVTIRVPADQAPNGAFAPGPLVVRLGHRWPWTKEVALTVSDGSGCACSLLAQDADWNAATWSLRPESREDLATTVHAVGDSLATDFTFEALWMSDEAQGRVELNLRALVELIRRGEIGTRTRYLVHYVVAA
jgi:hypothetical protein